MPCGSAVAGSKAAASACRELCCALGHHSCTCLHHADASTLPAQALGARHVCTHVGTVPRLLCAGLLAPSACLRPAAERSRFRAVLAACCMTLTAVAHDCTASVLWSGAYPSQSPCLGSPNRNGCVLVAFFAPLPLCARGCVVLACMQLVWSRTPFAACAGPLLAWALRVPVAGSAHTLFLCAPEPGPSLAGGGVLAGQCPACVRTATTNARCPVAVRLVAVVGWRVWRLFAEQRPCMRRGCMLQQGCSGYGV